MRLLLSARPPFALATAVRSHGWWQLAPFDYREDEGSLTYITQLSSGRVVVLNIEESEDAVAVDTTGNLGATEQDEIRALVTWMLGLGQDFTDFYAVARQEPKLAHVEAQARGRILRSATLFEDLTKTILTTNTAWSGTKRMVLKLVEQYGAALPEDPSLRAFPTPERLAAVDGDTLRTSAGLGYRGPYVAELARQVAQGELDLEALKQANLSTAELRKRLLAIKGVGDYAAANLLMILGHYDFIPVDSWAIKVVSNEWYDGQPIGRAEVETTFERWGPWKGLVYWFWDYG